MLYMCMCVLSVQCSVGRGGGVIDKYYLLSNNFFLVVVFQFRRNLKSQISNLNLLKRTRLDGFCG